MAVGGSGRCYVNACCCRSRCCRCCRCWLVLLSPARIALALLRCAALACTNCGLQRAAAASTNTSPPVRPQLLHHWDHKGGGFARPGARHAHDVKALHSITGQRSGGRARPFRWPCLRLLGCTGGAQSPVRHILPPPPLAFPSPLSQHRTCLHDQRQQSHLQMRSRLHTSDPPLTPFYPSPPGSTRTCMMSGRVFRWMGVGRRKPLRRMARSTDSLSPMVSAGEWWQRKASLGA